MIAPSTARPSTAELRQLVERRRRRRRRLLSPGWGEGRRCAVSRLGNGRALVALSRSARASPSEPAPELHYELRRSVPCLPDGCIACATRAGHRPPVLIVRFVRFDGSAGGAGAGTGSVCSPPAARPSDAGRPRQFRHRTPCCAPNRCGVADDCISWSRCVLCV